MVVELSSGHIDWGILSPLSGTSLPQSPDCGPQVETLVSPPDGHDTTGEINPAIHGSNGPVKISVQDTTPLDSRIFNTTAQLAEFPFNQDMNSGNPLGIGEFCLTHVHSTDVTQTFARFRPVRNRRWPEEQCLDLIPYTGALQVELRYFN